MLQITWRHALTCVSASLIGAISSGLGSTPAATQSFPTGVVRIYVPTTPAAPPDIISRVVATELSEGEGWRVVVENKPGAVQTLAGLEVLRNPPDGHSIWAISLPVTAAPALLKNPGFKLDADFTPLIKASSSYNVLVVNPNVAAKSVAELAHSIRRSRLS